MKSKLLALFLGLAAVLIAGETALRVTGQVWRGKTRYEKNDGSRYTVLCLGDSFTFGSELLNSGGPGRPVSVLNGGIPGQNTAQILRHLEFNIEKAKPDLIVLLAGGANSWNLWGLDSGRFSRSEWLTRLAAAFNSIKVVKLTKLLYLGLDRKTFDRSHLYYEEAVSRKLQGDDLRAIELFGKIAELEPGNGNNYLQVAEIYKRMNNWSAALAWLEKGIKADPACRANYLAAGEALLRLGRNEESRLYLAKVLPEEARPSARPPRLSLQDTTIISWIVADLARIAAVCRERGIPLILLNYPPCPRSFFSHEIYDKAARNNSLPLADNYSAFLEQMNKGRALIGSDVFGHPNAEGYGLMARTVAAAIKKHPGTARLKSAGPE